MCELDESVSGETVTLLVITLTPPNSESLAIAITVKGDPSGSGAVIDTVDTHSLKYTGDEPCIYANRYCNGDSAVTSDTVRVKEVSATMPVVGLIVRTPPKGGAEMWNVTSA